MLEFIREASTLQFVAMIVALISGIMIVLQAAVRRAVWNGYLLLFFGALVTLLVTLR